MAVRFKDFTPVDYMPGEDELIKRQAKKRKMDTPTGNTGESVEPTDEAWTMAQRQAAKRRMMKQQPRLKIGRKKASMKVADAKRIAKRARRAARNMLAKKLTKGIAKADLTPARKAEIEKRLDKMQPRITRLAKKITPKLRQAELGRKRG